MDKRLTTILNLSQALGIVYDSLNNELEYF